MEGKEEGMKKGEFVYKIKRFGDKICGFRYSRIYGFKYCY